MNDIKIRLEQPQDYRAVENLVRNSFWNVYRPGCVEHYVLNKFRDDPDFIPELDFVMEKDGEIIGQNVFVRAEIKTDTGSILPVFAMGPICIANKFKRQGFGKILLDYTLQRAAEFGCKAVCIEGNFDFYGKSGFVHASTRGIRYHDLPENADSSFFLCKELTVGYFDDVTGVYSPPRGYFSADENPADFEKFDSTFPKKEKLILPGQIF